jgi:quinol monooxygenase YgiN
MGEAVSWMLELAVKPGQGDAFKQLMTEMVESTEAEPGALSYEWSITADGTVVHIYERYADSAATLAHLGQFGERFAERFLTAVTPTSLTVYGSPSSEVKDALTAFGPTYLGPFGGFVRS